MILWPELHYTIVEQTPAIIITKYNNETASYNKTITEWNKRTMMSNITSKKLIKQHVIKHSLITLLFRRFLFWPCQKTLERKFLFFVLQVMWLLTKVASQGKETEKNPNSIQEDIDDLLIAPEGKDPSTTFTHTSEDSEHTSDVSYDSLSYLAFSENVDDIDLSPTPLGEDFSTSPSPVNEDFVPTFLQPDTEDFITAPTTEGAYFSAAPLHTADEGFSETFHHAQSEGFSNPLRHSEDEYPFTTSFIRPTFQIEDEGLHRALIQSETEQSILPLVKQELGYKIRYKRLAEGKEEFIPEDPKPPLQYEVNPHCFVFTIVSNFLKIGIQF